MAPRLVCASASPCLARTCNCLNPFVTANWAGACLATAGGFAGADPLADRSAGSRTTRHTATRARHCQTSFGHRFIDSTTFFRSSQRGGEDRGEGDSEQSPCPIWLRAGADHRPPPRTCAPNVGGFLRRLTVEPCL